MVLVTLPVGVEHVLRQQGVMHVCAVSAAPSCQAGEVAVAGCPYGTLHVAHSAHGHQCCCSVAPRRTVVDVSLLQLWDSMRLCNPTISMSGFLKGIVDAVAILHPTQVCTAGTLVACLHVCMLAGTAVHVSRPC